MIDAYKPSFGIKYDTVKILETSTLKCIKSEGIHELRPVIDTFWDKPFKAAGSRGYKYYLQEIGRKITEKYPAIAEATNAILEFINKNPKAKKTDLQEFVQPIIDKLGK